MIARQHGKTIIWRVDDSRFESVFRCGDVLVVLVSDQVAKIATRSEDAVPPGGRIVGVMRGEPLGIWKGRQVDPASYVAESEEQGIVPLIWETAPGESILYEAVVGVRGVADRFGDKYATVAYLSSPAPIAFADIEPFLRRSRRVVYGADMLAHPMMPV